MFCVNDDATLESFPRCNDRPISSMFKVLQVTQPLVLVTQERASKQLPGPGQHFSFGALKPWEDILAMLQDYPGGNS
jgi:hypothetical protein